MNRFLLTVVVFAALFLGPASARGLKPLVALQPLGTFDTTMTRAIVDGIKATFSVETAVLAEKPIPESAYYAPKKRYRAEKILRNLETDSDIRYTRIAGLTNFDISTTKGAYYDWGIFGLGMYNGRACVISTFRLKKGKASKAVLTERLIKVVNHELGHTFGLWHCPNQCCLMEDAQGTIKTVDRETGKFCADCAAQLKGIIK